MLAQASAAVQKKKKNPVKGKDRGSGAGELDKVREITRSGRRD